jgi:hypothetical protein
MEKRPIVIVFLCPSTLDVFGELEPSSYLEETLFLYMFLLFFIVDQVFDSYLDI